jgi:hypothetical protein
MQAMPTPQDSIASEAKSAAAKHLAQAAIGGLVVMLAAAVLGWWLYLQPRIQALTGGLPQGAVVAFDLPTGCPAGWVAVPDAAGRTVVGSGHGAGLSNRQYRDTGGVERHQLTIDELPSHTHQGYVGLGGPSFEHHKNNNRMPSDQWQEQSGPTGGSEAHENMQPFLVLHYCKRT